MTTHTVFARTALWIALAAFVSCLCASSIIWENGDVEHKWFVAKAWADFHFPPFPFNHHNLRWGMNLPATAAIRLFGDTPLVYILLNLTVFSATTGILFFLMRQASNFWIAALAVFIWLCNPTSYFMASNLMPGLYSVFYLSLTFYLLYASNVRNSWRLYLGAVIMLFVAYGAKETNVFFYPGLGLYELWRRRYDRLALLIGVSAALLLCETLTIDLALRGVHIVGGRLEGILKGNHIEGMRTIYNVYKPIDILLRWGFQGATEIPSKLIYYGFIIASAFLIVQQKRQPTVSFTSHAAIDETVLAASFMGLSFAFCTTFFILSLHPFIPGQPLADIYLEPLLAPAFLCCSAATEHIRSQYFSKLRLSTLEGAPTASVSWLPPRLWRWREIICVVSIALFAGGARLAFANVLTHSTRGAYALPYNAFGINDYYHRLVRGRLDRGCTLVFASERAAWSAIGFAYPFGYFRDPVALYTRHLDGLQAEDGAVLRAQTLPVQSAPSLSLMLPTKLHVNHGPEAPSGVLVTLRLDHSDGRERNCPRPGYLGLDDINERDQGL